MNTLESELKRLPEPRAPEALSARVMARIAQVDAERAAAAAASAPAPVEPARDRLAWALLLSGFVVGLGAQTYRLVVGEGRLDLMAPRIRGGVEGMLQMVPATPAVVVLAVGTLLYLAGLFTSSRAAAHGAGDGATRS
jgi:hypothetical protein